MSPHLNAYGKSSSLYAPTLQCTNYSPLEAVTAYVRWGGSFYSTSRAFGIWDHNNTSNGNNPNDNLPAGAFVVWETFDSTWMSKYTRPDTGGSYYEVITQKRADSGSPSGVYWETYLYNYNTSSWDRKYYTPWDFPGVRTRNGWSIFETYFLGTCPYIPSIRSLNNQYYINGYGWTWLTENNSSKMSNQVCKSGYYNFSSPWLYSWTVP